MSERTPWVIDYSTANPPPATDLSAYATQQWVLQNLVEDVRQSGIMNLSVGSNANTQAPQVVW
ncbi:Uncharacterised protein [Citrobacter freundii]|nr:Uncharacterised protein [Citrobacter freundii]